MPGEEELVQPYATEEEIMNARLADLLEYGVWTIEDRRRLNEARRELEALERQRSKGVGLSSGEDQQLTQRIATLTTHMAESFAPHMNEARKLAESLFQVVDLGHFAEDTHHQIVEMI